MRSTPFARSLTLLAAALGSSAARAAAQTVREWVYTHDADFGRGQRIDLALDGARGGALELPTATEPLPLISIACSARGTVVRVDVESGAVLGEYATAPDGLGRNPSRTTVDRAGNTWVCNRDEAGWVDGQSRGSVARIGLVLGGTRGRKDAKTGAFEPDAHGEYLRGPFRYSTCVDRDGDGLLRTSRGLGDVLAWRNEGGADSAGGVTTAEDECVVNYVRVGAALARTLAVDANDDVWVGGFADQEHEKLDGRTGLPVAGTRVDFGCGGYGGLVDGNGVLWSARGGRGLLRFDPASGGGRCLGSECGDYGLALDPATGNVWHTSLHGGSVGVLSPAGECIARHACGADNAQGLAVDAAGNVWVAHSQWGPQTVGHLRTDGTLVGNVALVHASGRGDGPTGVSVDTHGKVWVVCVNSNNALRIDPNAGALGAGGFPVGAVDLVVELGAGAGPYDYSDMTGFVALGATAPSGTWTIVHDGAERGRAWESFAWHAEEPAGTRVAVEVRAGDEPATLAGKPFEALQSGAPLCDSGLAGRFVELRATLSRLPGVRATPRLLDVTLRACERPAQLACPADFSELWAGGDLAAQVHPDRTGWATYVDPCERDVRLAWEDARLPRITAEGPELVLRRTWLLSDGCGTRETCTQTIALLSPRGRDGALTLDVQPGECPNRVALRGSTATRVALVGTWLFDATTVVPASLELRRVDRVGDTLHLEDFPLTVSQDVARPFYGAPGECRAEPGDGRPDALLTLPNARLAAAFALERAAPGARFEFELTGRLRDGTDFAVRDWIEIQ